ncbi:MAG: T9SS type A sorting domain-containing protein [Flavobacteriales bacterium]|nr:T9SS type A sorting domain-containing protein [Flavobacteriales bacterium]
MIKKLLVFIALSISFGQAYSQVTTSSIYTEPDCFGYATGDITITAAGGDGSYTYAWSQGQTDATITNLVAGVYTVTVTDGLAETATEEVTLTEPDVVFVIVDSFEDPYCTGGNDGNISYTFGGGIAPYDVSWEFGNDFAQSGPTYQVFNYAAGFYTTTITDQNGCTAEVGEVLVDPLPMTATISSVDPSCFQLCDGSIDVTVDGGQMPYWYDWSDGNSGIEDLNGVCSGSYTITVTDQFGCTVNVSATVTDPSTIAINLVPTDDVCGGSTGSIDLSAFGGTPGYTYWWASGEITEDLTGLSGGTYTVTVTDANACDYIDQVIISDGGLIGSISIVDASCDGFADGFIDVTVSGGDLAYTYTWNDIATTEDRTGLGAGTYTVTVVDGNGCTTTLSGTVTEPIMVSNTFTTVHPTCNACTDGWSMASATGGTGSYTYSWSTTETTVTASALTIGTYTVTISDDNLCTLSEEVTLVDTVCGSCAQIKGLVFDDTNGNGVQDGGENGIGGVYVTADSGAYATVSDLDGIYRLVVENDADYYITILLPEQIYGCSGAVLDAYTQTLPVGGLGIDVSVADAANISLGNDFGIEGSDIACGYISGFVFSDENGNEIYDAGDLPYKGALIQIGTGEFTVSDGDGTYSFEYPKDQETTITMIPVSNNENYYCSSTNITTVEQVYPAGMAGYTITLTTGNDTISDLDFGLNQSAPVIASDARIVSVRPYSSRAGQDFKAWMDFKNYGNDNTNCVLRLEHDALISFNNASMTPKTVAATYVEWEFSSLSSYFGHCMEMQFHLDESATAGMELEWTGSIGCDLYDPCPNNNSMTRTVEVSSYQKSMTGGVGFNSMEVFHSGDEDIDLISADSLDLSYVINYQNVSNDTVFNLTIVDTLPSYLDVTTISRPFSSHHHTMTIVDNNILVLQYDDIVLTDSTSDYLNSYGFAQFNIRMKKNVPYGETITNDAELVYNYNTTFKTNNVDLIIDDFVGAKKGIDETAKIRISSHKQSVRVETADGGTATVYNTLGQQVMRKKMNQGLNKFKLNRNGIYLIKVTSKSESTTRKVLLEN